MRIAMGRNKVGKEKPKEYQFGVGDTVVYIGGLYDEYTDKECSIIARHKVKKFYEWYRVVFNDNLVILTTVNTLRGKEENDDAI